ncbi:MAG: hypothetical protein ACQESE_04605 [Nanobdellota archaeon]
MTIIGDVKRFKERLKQEYVNELNEIEQDHKKKLEELKKRHEQKRQGREVEIRTQIETEQHNIIEREKQQAKRESEREYQEQLDKVFTSITAQATELLTTQKTGHTLTTDKEYVKKLKNLLKNLDKASVIAHTSTFKSKLNTTVKTNKKQTGVVIETDDVVYDYTFEAFAQEHEEKLKELIEKESKV